VKPLALALLLFGLSAASAMAHQLPREDLQRVGFTQHVGAQVPLDLEFVDEHGQTVRLRDYFGSRPVLLSLNDLRCPNLCPLELQGLIGGLNGVPFTLGDQYTLITVSFSPRDTPSDAAEARFHALRGYVHPEAAHGWAVLTTSEQAAIDQLTQSVGFGYVYDDQEDDYAHPLGVIALTPDGRISRYVYGLDFSATDLRLALVDAAQRHIGGVVEQVMLLCYQYDALTGRYTPFVLDLLKIAGAATVLVVAGGLFVLWRADLKRA
jgi:protein SCO1/2